AAVEVEYANVQAERRLQRAAEAQLIKTWKEEGWTYSGSDHVFFRWAETEEGDCSDFQCTAVDISTTDVPCPNHVSIEVSIKAGDETIGTVSERTSGLGTYSDSRVWIENRT